MANFGILSTFILGLFVPSDDYIKTHLSNNYWRLMFGIPMATCAIRMLLFLFLFRKDPTKKF